MLAKSLNLAFLFLWLLAVPGTAQQRAAVAQRTPAKVTFDRLSDFVNDFDHRHPGDRFIVSGVPMPKKITFERAYKMYLFQPDPDGGVATSFYTSLAAKNVLQPYLESATASLHITCMLIEFAGEFDIYRTPFATKIEGIGADGKVVWTADGTPPVKLKFRQ
jgi:hypothetical protein